MPPKDASRPLALLVRGFGLLDSLAALAVLLPRNWMAAAAREIGVGPLPPGPLMGYLARITSLLFAVHGVTLLFISFDVVRYDRLIRFLAIVSLVQGAVALGIDLGEGLPWWWCLSEGPGVAGMGALLLLVRHATNPRLTTEAQRHRESTEKIK